ncbi:MAG: pyruvate, water dikinase regulatory protein [Anaerolineae bacterium]
MEPGDRTDPPPIYLVSGGTGASGEQLVHTVLAQFPGHQVPVITVPRVQHAGQVADVVARAASDGGTIVHTMVDARLRLSLTRLAQQHGVACIDLMGDLLSRLTEVLGQQPIGRPGLYRQLHQAYFERVAAIEFAMTHDDGKNPQGWPQAEIVLVGVSRVGKTPLSMYLSVLGWKVANIPLVPGLPPPTSLFQLDRRRVVGLDIEPGQLVIHRQQRQRHLGAPGPSAYTDPQSIYEELEAARRIFQQGGFTVVDVTDKPIETSADEIISRVTRQLRLQARK